MKRSGNNPKVVALLGLLVIAAVYMMLIKPQGAELSAARDEAANARIHVDDALVMLARARPDTSADESSDVQELALDRAVPPSPEQSELLRQLQTIADDTGVAYASVSPTLPGPNPAGPGGSAPLTINASGPGEAIDAYLGRIRDLERLLVIETVSTLSQSGVTQLQLTIRAFHTAGQPPVPAA